MCMENSIELEEENQGKLFTISEIGKMLGKTRSMIVGLIDELKLVSKCDKTKKYNGDDINKIKELIEFKKCFRSLYSTDEIHKICGIAFASVTNIINDLQLKGVTYGQWTRYDEDELKQIQKFIEEHPNSKTYFYEKTCVEKYGVKNVFLRKDVKDKAIKNSHTRECIEKQRESAEKHFEDEGGFAKHMSDVNKERWNNYTEEEKEEIQVHIQSAMIEKYGVDNCSKLDWVKEKKKESTLKSIGFDNPLKDRERMERGMFAKYGVKHDWESKEILKRRGESYHRNYEEYKKNKDENTELRYNDKSAETYNKGYEDYKNNKNLYDELKYNDKAELTKRMLYGDNYATKFADKANETKRRLYGDDFGKKFWDKADETCRELYGDDYREKLTKKSMETNRKNHGGLHNTQTKESQEKMKQTYFERTGYYHPSQNPKTRRNHRTCYYYDNEEFDSSWELAYYIYLKDHNIQFEYHTISVPYEWNGKTHYYKIDFKVGDEYVEIKGDHLLKKNVYTEDGRCEAKYEYMKEHNITILSLEEIKPYLKYIKDVYGKDYLKSFRKKDENKK